jgi:CubicO group peptidase (beta-lactamase class C family)
VYDQTPIFFGGYGRSNWTNPSSPPPTPDNIVWVASITKIFTSMLSYQLRDDGIWSLDDPLTKYYPDFQPYIPSKVKRGLTLRSLAGHTSGLPRENPCPNCNEENILKKLSNEYMLWAPYAAPHYSNLGFSFLGRAAEKALPDQPLYVLSPSRSPTHPPN